MQVSKWGNSLAIRLPGAVVELPGLNEADKARSAGQQRGYFRNCDRRPTPADLLARLRQYHGRLPADFKFDRLEANARGE